MNIRVDNIVRVSDVCEVFEVTTMTVWHWRKKFGMPHISVPGARPMVLFDKSLVDKWAVSHNKKRMHPWPELQIERDSILHAA